ncbi:MAG: D-alanyl-D-alanine carboxypeptidase/D-alanyl-D-alanine-endopeptidase [Akkermansiaceae bacterium]|nr:D-alanyl-D-alanine carboxypeptidase/D-alanyl-D-alanine-endopeptidase [Akkermansiaceae bacterium]NNM29811.1 D-alanyl-D-alanine carboxypeptidase/D-alanyl-D-alanine-endopeptidase [Akkermansiaceae bacterium]
MIRLLALLLALPVLAADEGDLAPVIAEVARIQDEKGMRTATIGFALIPLDAEDASALEGYHPDTALIPASTLKAVTTATAAELLGPDFRFVTRLQHTGTVAEDGTLDGDIIVRGGGDPTLGSSQIARTFAKWHAALTEAGIRQIDGAIIGDASAFGTRMRPDSWQWNDLGNYYAAGACGLNFHQNQFFCRFRTGKAGTKAGFLGTDPRMPGVEFVNEMRVGPAGSGDHGYVYGAPYGTLLYLRGTVPAGASTFTIRGALPDPAYFCARAFTKHLAAKGVSVTGEPSTVRILKTAGKSLGARTDLFEQSSEPLAKLLVTTNHRSDNLHAECIHRIMGVEHGEGGSTAAASRVVTAHWKAKGIDLTGFHMADGCGLSRINTITARQMALVHYHAAKCDGFEAFRASLPVAGKSGTLRSIGRETAAAGRVRAKSGSIDRVKCYAGYIHARSGRRFAFALLINNYTAELYPLKTKIVRVWSKVVAL